MRKIAFFDFDGTITTKDTLFEVIKHHKGHAKLFAGLLLNAPVLMGLKIKLISNQRAKEAILKYFFKGTELAEFQSGSDRFAMEALPAIIRPGALAEVKKLKAAGFQIVVVSASAENWIKKWADQMDIGLIATRLEIADSKLTGKIADKNCNGEEKVVRIKATYNLSEFDEIYCYGDSTGDKQMLALATKAFYQPFR
jgi:phosphatidylglycerophosphatase C